MRGLQRLGATLPVTVSALIVMFGITGCGLTPETRARNDARVGAFNLAHGHYKEAVGAYQLALVEAKEADAAARRKGGSFDIGPYEQNLAAAELATSEASSSDTTSTGSSPETTSTTAAQQQDGSSHDPAQGQQDCNDPALSMRIGNTMDHLTDAINGWLLVGARPGPPMVWWASDSYLEMQRQMDLLAKLLRCWQSTGDAAADSSIDALAGMRATLDQWRQWYTGSTNSSSDPASEDSRRTNAKYIIAFLSAHTTLRYQVDGVYAINYYVLYQTFGVSHDSGGYHYSGEISNTGPAETSHGGGASGRGRSSTGDGGGFSGAWNGLPLGGPDAGN